ncbi:MAG: HlyC/CorC family transporter [Candidatus Lambdaproteobacteria bacterium]|nr:HlyC/CorC family transporter [Candidatus Lambdaproteobacteria bacterium]
MDIPYPELAGILVCLVLSGFFSGTETALTSLSYIKVDQLIANRPAWGRVLNHWKHNHTGILTTILIGNNVANITASALATDVAAIFFSSNSIPIAVGAMTFLLLFTGEITPKTVARAYAERLALPLMTLILVFHYLLFPVSWLITVTVGGLVRISGGRTKTHDRVTEADLEFIVNLSKREGTIDADKQSMLNAIFEFGATVTREIMMPRTEMVALPVDTPYEKVLEVALNSGFSRIPIYEESQDKILGIFHTKDLIIPPDEEHRENFLSSYIRPPLFVPESKKISEVLKIFQRDQQHMAIVVDEFGGTAGIVTMEDIIEELLGDIRDEFDVSDERLLAMPDRSFMADARVDIEDLEHLLHIAFPEERDYESLGGYLIEEAGDVPAVGWSHAAMGYAFQVVEADANRIIKVHITRLDSSAQGDAADDDPPTDAEPKATAVGE